MKRRVSVASLMVVVCGVALVLTALRTLSTFWTAAVFYATVGTLIAAAVQARYRRGADGAWWLGFVLFGCANLLTAPGKHISSDYLLGQFLAPLMWRSTAFEAWFSGIREFHKPDNLGLILFSLWTLIVALAGAAVVRFWYSRAIGSSVRDRSARRGPQAREPGSSDPR